MHSMFTGITPDTLVRLASLTACIPAITAPLLILARYTTTGQAFARDYGALVGLGAAYRVNGWLNGVVGK